MGLGVRSVAIAELAVERMMAMGAEASETRVTLALALCQAGRADEALIMLDQVDRSYPYAAAIQALASAMTGDAPTALESAALLGDAPSATYLDRVIAAVAAAAADVSLGNTDEATDRIDAAAVTASEAGDVVARALVRAARQVLLEELESFDIDSLGPGWRRVVQTLAASAHPS
jgi:hypothetical protein